MSPHQDTDASPDHEPRATFEFFDHTGDFGAEVRGPDAGSVLDGFVSAFLTLLTDAPDSVETPEWWEITLEGFDHADLLVALGNELLFMFENEGLLVRRFELRGLDEDYLSGVCYGEPYDPQRHPIARPIKAATHHGAELKPVEDGWRARLIFDL